MHGVWEVKALKSFEAACDLGFEIHSFPKNHLVYLVYLGLSTRRVHFSGERRHARRRDENGIVFAASSAACRSAAFSTSEDISQMAMARGHSRCCSCFEGFSGAIANWCSSMKFNLAPYDVFIDVLFCSRGVISGASLS